MKKRSSQLSGFEFVSIEGEIIEMERIKPHFKGSVFVMRMLRCWPGFL